MIEVAPTRGATVVDDLNPRDVRRSLKPEIYVVVVEMVETHGWKLRRQGHGYRLFCPCPRSGGGRGVPVPGTPANPGNAAKRLRRNLEHCPGSHELMK